MFRDYDNWNLLKKKLNERKTYPLFKEREIWWCSIGINIGVETNGKNKLFNRPVLILKKFNENIFWGIPLTSKIKKGKFYYNFYIANKTSESCAMLLQLKVFTSKRLGSKIGLIEAEEFMMLKEKIKEMI